MFTDLGFKLVSKFLPPSKAVNILPFIINVKEHSLSLNQSKKALVFRLLYLFLELSSLFYNLVRLYITMTGPSLDEAGGTQITHCTMHIIMALKYGLGAGIMINILFMAKDIVTVFNEMVRLETYFKEFIQKDSKYKDSKTFERVAFFFFGVSMNSPVTFALLFLTLPDEHCYIYSLVPQEYKSHYLFAVFMSIEVFSSFKSIKTVCFYFMYFTIGVSFTSHWTQVLSSENLSVQEHLDLYDKLRVFNIYYNKSYLRLLLSFIVGIGSMFSIMSIFGTIRLYGSVTFGAYMIYPVLILNSTSFLGLIFILGAKINANSTALIKKLKLVTKFSRDKAIKRKIKSIQSFGMRAVPKGNFDNLSFFKYLSGVIETTISLLVAYP